MDGGAVAVGSAALSISFLASHASTSACSTPLYFAPRRLPDSRRNCRAAFFVSPRRSLSTFACAAVVTVEKSNDSVSPLSSHSSAFASSITKGMPKVDKTGKFCSPRAARELALLTLYAACLEGSDPVRLFEKRLNFRKERGYEFDKDLLLDYDHMGFSGPPVTTETVEEAEEILLSYEKESEIEAAVLSAPPKLVYSRLILRFARKLLVSIVERWDNHVVIIEKVVPSDWKNVPASRIMELCILHLAMSEISGPGTRYQIVINEAVDLAKRFCEGAAPRIINGCLRTFLRGLGEK